MHRSQCYSVDAQRYPCRRLPAQRDVLAALSSLVQSLVHPAIPTLFFHFPHSLSSRSSHGEGCPGAVRLAAHRLRVDPALSTRLLFGKRLSSLTTPTALLPGSRVFWPELKLWNFLIKAAAPVTWTLSPTFPLTHSLGHSTLFLSTSTTLFPRTPSYYGTNRQDDIRIEHDRHQHRHRQRDRSQQREHER
jgi:hypothetical protein